MDGRNAIPTCRNANSDGFNNIWTSGYSRSIAKRAASSGVDGASDVPNGMASTVPSKKVAKRSLDKGSGDGSEASNISVYSNDK